YELYDLFVFFVSHSNIISPLWGAFLLFFKQSQSWENTRKLILEENQLLTLVDITEAFQRVKLEQVIVICRKLKNHSLNYIFKTGDYWRDKIQINSQISSDLARKLGILPIYIDNQKLTIYQKLISGSEPLGIITKTFRGLQYQSRLAQEGYEVLRGDNIKKYRTIKPLDKVALSSEGLNNQKVQKLMKPKIVSQNIIAHVKNPYDRIIVMATYDKDGLLTLDTVMNTYILSKDYSYEYILGILNSRLAEWFYYWFIYNRAVRTMHFDEYYMGRLPIKKITPQNQHIVQQIENLVDQILNLTQSEDYETNPTKQAQVQELEKQIDKLVYELYGLTPEEIAIIEGNA
ncbi:TaqI-like C-terminal specificity domain-containing protein, partial [Hydrogenobacter hydrogenophilus]